MVAFDITPEGLGSELQLGTCSVAVDLANELSVALGEEVPCEGAGPHCHCCERVCVLVKWIGRAESKNLAKLSVPPLS